MTVNLLLSIKRATIQGLAMKDSKTSEKIILFLGRF